MKHRSKRALGVLLSLVLALVMLVGLFPAAALAEAPNDEPETGYDTQLDTKPGDDPEDPLPPQTLGEGDDTALTKGGAAVPEDEPLSETEESGKALYYAKNGTIEENDLDMKALSGPVSYLDENNSSAECYAYTVVDNNTTTWTDNTNNGWYVVDEDVTIGGRITVDGDVSLILCDSATLTADSGITVEGNNSLTIYAQSTGENTMGALEATAVADNEWAPIPAGIGGYEIEPGHFYQKVGGTLTINGGKITATGASCNGYGGAGIGGCNQGLGGDVTINGGIVTANGGDSSAGIGGGCYYNGDDFCTVTINGGTVIAKGGMGGAGIGGSYGGHGINITVNGGTVEATGGTAAAGIGDGAEYNGERAAWFRIYGGTVTATGGDGDDDIGYAYGAGIGGGTHADGDAAANQASRNRGGIDIDVSVVTIYAGSSSNNMGEVPYTHQLAGFGFKDYHMQQYVKTVSAAPTVPVTGVTLDKTETQTIFVDGTVSFTATVEPDSATDKTVKWSVGGNDTGAVKLYSDATCTTEVGTDATDTMTVYAKGISAGSASVIVTSNADSTKTATCAVTVEAAPAGVAYRYYENGEFKDGSCTDYTVVTGETTTFENSKWYVVNSDVNIAGGITVSGTAHLILCDGKTLTVDGGQKNAGICVSHGNALTIYAQSEGENMGALTATGGWFSAGIGGKYDYFASNNTGGTEQEAGTITINGGNITAFGCQALTSGLQQTGGAGIGGAYFGEGGTITINGGIVNATAGIAQYNGSAGIGTGYWSRNMYGTGNTGSTTVTINGGTVTATGYKGGAGIGGAYENQGGTVNINGGTVIATGGSGGVGIGGGASSGNNGTLNLGEGVGIIVSTDNTTWSAYDGSTRVQYMKTSEVPAVPVTGVMLDKTETQTIFVDGTVSFTATVAPDSATDKTVKWSVGGNDTGAVKLYSDATCTTEVGTDASDTMTVYAKGISAGSASVIVTSNADSTKTATCAVTVTEASAIFEGGGLRRRVLTGTRTAVNTSTDLRLVFIYALPEGAALVSDESAEDYSYILWDTGSGALNNKVTAKKTFEEGGKTKCALVITRVPNTAFSSSIHAQLHLVYTLNEQTYSVDSDVGSRSVNDICTTLKSRTDTWADYAKFLLGEIDSYEIPA